MKNISQEVLAEKDFIFNARRDFHMHPEMGRNEFRTQKKVVEYLKSCGYEVREKVADTGVIGILRGKQNGKTFLIRADMDGLPITEENDIPYRSQNKGVMHACGHDGHMAINLGLAKVLTKMRDKISGNIKFLFQPDEEGSGGAERMIKDGALENPHVDIAFGYHLFNELPAGNFVIANDYVFAHSQTFDIKVIGKDTHGAHPHRGIDPIYVSTHIIEALYGIIAREKNPLDSGLITVGTIHAGTARNVIPECCEFKGIIRSYQPEMSTFLAKRIKEVAEGIAEVHGAHAEITIKSNYPAVKNNNEVAEKLRAIAEKHFGKEAIHTERKSLGAEDMSYFLNAVPGCYFFIGSKPNNNHSTNWHSATFNIDEDALLYGVEFLKEIVFD